MRIYINIFTPCMNVYLHIMYVGVHYMHIRSCYYREIENSIKVTENWNFHLCKIFHQKAISILISPLDVSFVRWDETRIEFHLSPVFTANKLQSFIILLGYQMNFSFWFSFDPLYLIGLLLVAIWTCFCLF